MSTTFKDGVLGMLEWDDSNSYKLLKLGEVLIGSVLCFNGGLIARCYINGVNLDVKGRTPEEAKDAVMAEVRRILGGPAEATAPEHNWDEEFPGYWSYTVDGECVGKIRSRDFEYFAWVKSLRGKWHFEYLGAFAKHCDAKQAVVDAFLATAEPDHLEIERAIGEGMVTS